MTHWCDGETEVELSSPRHHHPRRFPASGSLSGPSSPARSRSWPADVFPAARSDDARHRHLYPRGDIVRVLARRHLVEAVSVVWQRVT